MPAFSIASRHDQRRILCAVESSISFPPHTTKVELELAEWQRQLIRRGTLSGVDLGKGSDGVAEMVSVFLLEGMLLIAAPIADGMMYRQHQLLKDDTEVSELSVLAFMVASGSRSYRFTAPDERSKELWLRDLVSLICQLYLHVAAS